MILILCNCSEVAESDKFAIDSGEIKTHRENITSELEFLGENAIQHYRTPAALGGGGDSFNNWEISDSLKESEYGSYDYELLAKDKLKLIGVGKIIGNDRVNPIKLEEIVYPTEIMEVEVIN